MTTSLISIKVSIVESEYLPDNGNVYVMEQYLDDFYVICRKAVSEATALMIIAKYLTEAEAEGKERPKYRNLKEQILADHKTFWDREFEEIKWKRNYTNDFPISFSHYPLRRRTQQPDESTKPQDSPVQDSE